MSKYIWLIYVIFFIMITSISSNNAGALILWSLCLTKIFIW